MRTGLAVSVVVVKCALRQASLLHRLLAAICLYQTSAGTCSKQFAASHNLPVSCNQKGTIVRTTQPTVTELDAARIREFAGPLHGFGRMPAVGDLLEWVATETDVVPSDRIAPDVVTMGSTVSFMEVGTRAVCRVSVVHPVDVSIEERRISVLSPVGRALFGRRVGEFTTVEMPDGGEREIEIRTMHYQPEAAGVPRP